MTTTDNDAHQIATTPMETKRFFPKQEIGFFLNKARQGLETAMKTAMETAKGHRKGHRKATGRPQEGHRKATGRPQDFPQTQDGGGEN